MSQVCVGSERGRRSVLMSYRGYKTAQSCTLPVYFCSPTQRTGLNDSLTNYQNYRVSIAQGVHRVQTYVS